MLNSHRKGILSGENMCQKWNVIRELRDKFINERIGVLMGGPSSERDISLLSGEAVFDVLSHFNLNVIGIVVPENKSLEYLSEWLKKKLIEEKVTLIFNALHGWFGEDGEVQKILDELEIPYSGSGELASRLAMNKIKSREIFLKNMIPVPRYFVINKKENYNMDGFRFPLIIKPSSQGSSVGLFKVRNEEEFKNFIPKVLSYDGKVLVEEFIDGMELTVGVLDEEPLPVIRIKPKEEFYNYKAKYTPGKTQYIVPANIDEKIEKRAKELGLRAHQSLGCSGFSRVDMVYSSAYNDVIVLEVNTIPGLTPTSLLPKAAKVTGIGFPQLILRMLNTAFSRDEKEIKL
jgi:D-alanine-D-alanine ligase